MKPDELVENYLSAWNRRDVDGLLALFHGGAAYYDAFWRETCVGRDLFRYLRDSFDEERYWYEQVGDLIVNEDGIAFRYRARRHDGRPIGEAVFEGAEVLTLCDGKILTVSDYYCDPRTESLQEIVRLAVRRHGEPAYAKSGLGALKSSRYKRRLSDLMTTDKVYLDRTLTVSDLANRIGCTIEQLFQVVNSEYGSDFEEYVDRHRVQYARDLLLERRGDPDYISRVAVEAGFNSIHTFNAAFRKSFGVSPAEFHHSTKH